MSVFYDKKVDFIFLFGFISIRIVIIFVKEKLISP